LAGGWDTLRLALRFRRDPTPFLRRTSAPVVDALRHGGVPLDGARVLDGGTGSGAVAEALAAEGARVVALDVRDHRAAGIARTPFTRGRAERLPFRDGAFDVVVSSNVLEHVDDPWGVVDEALRVCAPGGLAYLSWTNWYSPIGGHEMSPFHYFGPRTAERVYRATRGRLPANRPGRTLFPLHVGPVLHGMRARPVDVIAVLPRYWPSLRFVAGVPVLREVAMWNCVIIARRRP
jgi:SAM-dependent methyltransferase